jgi:sulfur-carrier protein adenylyltransferase/sulfurtransferase
VSSWWLSDFRRVGVEKEAVEALARADDWFALTRWTINEFRFCAEGVITAHGVQYPVRLIYPDQFPNVPAWVEPQDSTVRWSNHQYGAGGILCLELRPDNWRPSATGAEVLRSAYGLLRAENPLGQGVKGKVPSGHRITDMQSYDWGQEPILIGTGCLERLKHGVVNGLSALRWHADDNVWPVYVFDLLDRAKPQHPPSFDLGTLRLELPVIVGHADLPTEGPSDRAALAALLGASLDPEIHKGGLIGIALTADAIVPYHSKDAASVHRRKWVVLPDDTGHRSDRSAAATEKAVAIVGLGSVGSKIAESVLRSGIIRLLLVDGDVLLPSNLERHTLDWRDVGFRKAHAVRRRLRHIIPGASIDVIPANLNWQRSASVHSEQIERLAACDLIVDATGEASTSLFLGAIAAANERSFVSCSVFEGGLGCLIARSIPSLDPAYSLSRAAYLSYCDQLNVPPPVSGRRTYEALNDAGKPIVADDAAVSMAAAHAARVALDVLDDKVTPADAAWLLIGFRKGWLFERHGHSIALDVGRGTPSQGFIEDVAARQFAVQLAREVVDAAKAAK